MRREPDSPVKLVVIPESRDLPRGTLHAILQQAGLTPEELVELL
jgi:predicted RNA binding protein YcfA (HicA-like mRNA interferase family)